MVQGDLAPVCVSRKFSLDDSPICLICYNYRPEEVNTSNTCFFSAVVEIEYSMLTTVLPLVLQLSTGRTQHLTKYFVSILCLNHHEQEILIIYYKFLAKINTLIEFFNKFLELLGISLKFFLVRGSK